MSDAFHDRHRRAVVWVDDFVKTHCREVVSPEVHKILVQAVGLALARGDEERDASMRSLLTFLQDGFCEEHAKRAEDQSPQDFVDEHLGKCLLCFERRALWAENRLASLRNAVLDLQGEEQRRRLQDVVTRGVVDEALGAAVPTPQPGEIGVC